MEWKNIKLNPSQKALNSIEKYAKMRVVPLRKRTKLICEKSMERRVNLILDSIEVLTEHGREYRPDLYTRDQVKKMFRVLRDSIHYSERVFESGLKATEKPETFTFDKTKI
jgi:hypothetical protein